MKYLLLISTMFVFSLLQAQDSGAEVEVETSEPGEDFSDYEDAGNTDYEYEYEEEVPEHYLVAPDQLRSTQEYRDGDINVNKFDIQKWREVTGGIDYTEEMDDEPEPVEFEPSTIPWNYGILKVIAYAIIIILIVFILYYISKNISVSYKLSKRKAAAVADLSGDVENIEELDIQALLQKAITERNFRLAVRLYYLDLLKRLNEASFIHWKKDKTNREYLSELSSYAHYEDVRKLTLAYERIWYGEYILSEISFGKLAEGFESMHQRLIKIPTA